MEELGLDKYCKWVLSRQRRADPGDGIRYGGKEIHLVVRELVGLRVDSST